LKSLKQQNNVIILLFPFSNKIENSNLKKNMTEIKIVKVQKVCENKY